jgi:hypothetical protein
VERGGELCSYLGRTLILHIIDYKQIDIINYSYRPPISYRSPTSDRSISYRSPISYRSTSYRFPTSDRSTISYYNSMIPFNLVGYFCKLHCGNFYL